MRQEWKLWQIHLLMLVCTFLVSTSFTVGKAIAGDMDPALLTLLRFIIAVFLMLPYLLVTKTLVFSWSLFLRAATISLSLVSFFWCMFFALRFTSALNTSVLFTLVPALSGLYAVVLVQEKISLGKVFSLLCGMLGALCVLFKGNLASFLALDWNRGDLIFLLGCFAMGFYTPLVKLLYRRGRYNEPMVVLTFWILVTGVLWLFLFAGYRLPWQQCGLVSGRVWAGILYLAFFTTVISFFLTQFSILYLGATRVISYSYLYPVFVVFLDFLAGQGLPDFRVFPGIALVLLAMVLLQREHLFSRS